MLFYPVDGCLSAVVTISIASESLFASLGAIAQPRKVIDLLTTPPSVREAILQKKLQKQTVLQEEISRRNSARVRSSHDDAPVDRSESGGGVDYLPSGGKCSVPRKPSEQ